ncbi:MAG TPA: PrsW family glutamic-type intramembrane protease, partial [Tepidisphaeraceae bacterium]|nr:PrsW family glutamic-type intramembrane protease [Tepidisphaeraceae bacterium]
RPDILGPISEYIPPPHGQPASSSQVLFIAANFVGFVIAEEVAKLVPVLVMIRMKWIRTTQAALCCGALAGMVFGLIESNCYGYIDFLGVGQPITEYLGRYVTMSTTHGLWDALGAGSAMWLGRRKARQGGSAPFAACVAGFLLTVAIHLCHNTLQAAISPVIQLITILGILLPAYILIKNGWQHREISPEELRPVPVVLALAILLGAGSAMAILVPWMPLRTGQQVALLSENVSQLDHLMAGEDWDNLQRITEEIEVCQPSLPRLHDSFAQIIQYLRDDGTHEIARMTVGTGAFSPVMLRRSIATRHPQRLLNDVRYELNRASNSSELSTINPTIRRWQIEITSIESPIQHPVDGKLCMILLSGQKLDEMLVPEELSESFESNLAAPWRTDVALQETQPILVLGHIDSHGNGRLLDAVAIPPKSFRGQLHLMRGSLANVHIHFDAE